MMNRAKVLMAAALLVGGATACSDLTGTTARADGFYSLQTLDGNTLPYSYVDNNSNNITIQSDTYTLNSDGTYNESASYRINGSTQSQTESGTWTQSNNIVTFNVFQSSTNNSGSYQGTIGNSNSFGGRRILTIIVNQTTAIYSE